MMRLRWASVIATLSLLAWAATAGAECAWVLWTAGETTQDLMVVGGHPSVQECSQDLAAYAAGFKRDGYEVRATGAYRVEAQKQGHKDVALACLPDTIDPRGPKGK